MSSSINANTCKKEDSAQQLAQDIELFLNLYFNGFIGFSAQKTQRDAYRNSISLADNQHQPNISLSLNEVENPNASPSKNEDLENSTHIYEPLEVDLMSYNFQGNTYTETIKRAKNLVKQKVEKYLISSEVKSIKIHAFIFGFDQGSPICNIFKSMENLEEEAFKKEVKKLFDDETFLNHPKIVYKKVEYLGLFDRVSCTIGIIGANAANLIGCSEIWCDVEIYPKANDNSPNGIDFWNAAILCQHTYTCQTAGEQSFVDWGYSKIKYVWGWIKGIFCKKPKAIQETNYWEKLKNYDSGQWKDMADIVNDTTVMNRISISSISNDGFKFKSVVSGLYSRLYAYVNKDNLITKYAYCTAGTNSLSVADWFSNIAQGLIGIAPQYFQAVRNAKILDKQIGDVQLLFIGHSLGGGLASCNAIVTKSRHAITFNAAGLNFLRVGMTLLVNNPECFMRIQERKRRIHPFIIEGEILHLSLAVFGELPYGVEKSSYMKINDGPVRWPVLGHIARSLKRHGLEGFIDEKLNQSFINAINNTDASS